MYEFLKLLKFTEIANFQLLNDDKKQKSEFEINKILQLNGKIFEIRNFFLIKIKIAINNAAILLLNRIESFFLFLNNFFDSSA
jgi:hypothetical protein